MSAYKQIKVSQDAKTLAVDIHKMTLNNLPRFEMYEQGQQIRRSSKSVPANIAELLAKSRAQTGFRFSGLQCLRVAEYSGFKVTEWQGVATSREAVIVAAVTDNEFFDVQFVRQVAGLMCLWTELGRIGVLNIFGQ